MRARATAAIVLAGLLPASAAFAAADKNESQAAAAALGVALFLTPSLQLVLAALAPGFTRRLRDAFRGSFWPCLGWGALLTLLCGIVAGVLSKGGGVGQALTGVVMGAAILGAILGLAGFSLAIGDWALRRWEVPSLGPLSVLLGAVLWTLGAVVPVVGWVAGLAMLLAALGALGRVLLERPRPTPPPPPELPAPGIEV